MVAISDWLKVAPPVYGRNVIVSQLTATAEELAPEDQTLLLEMAKSLRRKKTK